MTLLCNENLNTFLTRARKLFAEMQCVFVVAKVNWIKYTLAPKFEANLNISPKLQTWRLMCKLSPNLEAKVNFNNFNLGLG